MRCTNDVKFVVTSRSNCGRSRFGDVKSYLRWIPALRKRASMAGCFAVTLGWSVIVEAWPATGSCIPLCERGNLVEFGNVKDLAGSQF